MGRRRTLLAIAVVLICLRLNAEPPRLGPELRLMFTKSLPFSAADLDRAERGDPVALSFGSDSQKGVGIVGLVWVEGSRARFLDDQRTMSENAGTKAMPEAGIFGAPPARDDLDGLTIDTIDLEALLHCHPELCNVKLFRDGMRALEAIGKPGHRDAKRVVAAYEASLVRAVIEYKARGNGALGVYIDKPDPVDSGVEFDALLAETPFLRVAAPALERYLRNYPNAKPANSEDIFYWSKIAFGLKPTMRTNHMTLYPNPANRTIPWVIASKQIYAAHYLQTSLELRFLVIPPGSQHRNGFYLLTVSQSRNDGMEGFWRGIVRAVVRSKARDGVQRYLAFTQLRLGKADALEAHKLLGDHR